MLKGVIIPMRHPVFNVLFETVFVVSNFTSHGKDMQHFGIFSRQIQPFGVKIFFEFRCGFGFVWNRGSKRNQRFELLFSTH